MTKADPDHRRASNAGVEGNERLTALTSALLLAFILIALATTPNLHALLYVHVFVGILLIGPLAVKLGSTGYRFARYYTGAPTYVAKGPPHPALRVVAPALVLITLALLATGCALLVTGPADPGPFEGLHNLSFVLWFPLAVVHAFGHLRELPRTLAQEWRALRAAGGSGSAARVELNAGALLFGAIAGVVVLPTGAPWAAPGVLTQALPGPVVAAILVTGLVVLASRPWKWN